MTRTGGQSFVMLLPARLWSTITILGELLCYLFRHGLFLIKKLDGMLNHLTKTIRCFFLKFSWRYSESILSSYKRKISHIRRTKVCFKCDLLSSVVRTNCYGSFIRILIGSMITSGLAWQTEKHKDMLVKKSLTQNQWEIPKSKSRRINSEIQLWNIKISLGFIPRAKSPKISLYTPLIFYSCSFQKSLR